MNQAVIVPDRTVEPIRCREFRISDAMILLVGVALALASGSHLLPLLLNMLIELCRTAATHRVYLFEHWPIFWKVTHDSLRNTLWYGFQAAGTFLLGMWLPFFAVRLRRPRPPLRDLVRQPGTAAAMAMVIGLFWGTGGLLWAFPDKFDSVTAAPIAVGGAVAAAWAILVFSRSWKSEAGWVDRLGRILGGVAITTALLGLVIFRI